MNEPGKTDNINQLNGDNADICRKIKLLEEENARLKRTIEILRRQIPNASTGMHTRLKDALRE